MGTLPEPGLPDKPVVDEKHSPQPKPAVKEAERGMSEPVMMLLGFGAASMALGLITVGGDFDPEFPIMPLAFMGSGLVLWGVAGIVALTEDE